MRVIGKVTKAGLLEIQRRGLSPKQAFDAIISEAKRRHPDARGVIMQPIGLGDFEVIAL